MYSGSTVLDHRQATRSTSLPAPPAKTGLGGSVQQRGQGDRRYRRGTGPGNL